MAGYFSKEHPMRSQLGVGPITPHISEHESMATLPMSVRGRLPATAFTKSEAVDEEELVVDDRAGIRPAQMVEDKLTDILKGDFMMVSQMRLKDLLAHRN